MSAPMFTFTVTTSPSLPLKAEPLVEVACTRTPPSGRKMASKLFVLRAVVRSVLRYTSGKPSPSVATVTPSGTYRSNSKPTIGTSFFIFTDSVSSMPVITSMSSM